MNYTTFGAFWTKNARQNMLLDIIAPDNPKSNASRQCSRKYPCGGLQCVLAVLDGSLTGDCLLLRKLGHCCIRCNAEGSCRGFGIPCEVHLGVIGTGGERYLCPIVFHGLPALLPCSIGAVRRSRCCRCVGVSVRCCRSKRKKGTARCQNACQNKRCNLLVNLHF